MKGLFGSTIFGACLLWTCPIRCLAFSSSFASLSLAVGDSIRFSVSSPLQVQTCRSFQTCLSASTIDSPATEASPLSADGEKDPTVTVTLAKDDAFSLLADVSATALLKSDFRRDAVGKDAGQQASSATNWIDEHSAFALQQALNKLVLKLADERTGLDRDEASTWIRWMKATPTPLIIDLSRDLQRRANETILDENLDLLDTTRPNFLKRLGCRLILLPSGAELRNGLVEPTGGLIYGKLLYGGVTRFRLLSSSTSSRPPRRVGENTATKESVKDNIPSWIQYGGADRRYEGVDMGPAAVLELTLLPIGKEVPSVFEKKGGDMALSRMCWNPEKMFSFVEDGDAGMVSDATTMEDALQGSTPMALSGKDRNEAFSSDFRGSVGGLSRQIDAIVRRVLDGRVIRPADEDGGIADAGDMTPAELSMAAMEAEELAILGLNPVRGLLLYGPPGCGKTALAREISKALRARVPKIVSAPELLDRWVGGSEKLVRSLFAEAEAELAACNGDATKSALHVVVIDEIDAVFRKRSTAEDSGEATRSSAVNQILAKLDGVNAIPNVLLIGMTNRRELLDEALLRPGRLEVQIEIPLPDREGRREIMQIHFDALRQRGRLSKPLCCAIDGVAGYDDRDMTGVSVKDSGEEEGHDVDQNAPIRGRKRRALKRVMNKVLDKVPVGKPTYDLAADNATGGFSGADIAGLVRCAGSIALARARRDGGGVEGLLITLEDVKDALVEVKR